MNIQIKYYIFTNEAILGSPINVFGMEEKKFCHPLSSQFKK